MALAETHTSTPVIEHPAVTAARLRAKCERAVDRLLAMLDTLDTPSEDLEDGGDTEAEPAEHDLTGLAIDINNSAAM